MLLNNSDLELRYLTESEELKENPEQWDVFNSKGNCVVLAGPGSGKTKVLTLKMAKMLKEDVKFPRGIACITYNSECARALEKKLQGLGVEYGKNIFIGTVHSFCLNNIILPFAQAADLRLASPIQVVTPAEQNKLFNNSVAKVISADVDPNSWRTKFEYYRRVHLDRTSAAWKTDDGDLCELVEFYEQSLHRKGLIDFDDMVQFGFDLVSNHEWIRRALKARFPILVIDEYQDLGQGLHEIVLKLCFEAKIRLLAVGDADQSIYGFAGAKPELLRDLSLKEGVEAIKLRFNYRSGQTIIGASETVLGEKRNYVSKKEHEGTIEIYECQNGLQEQVELICGKIIPETLKNNPTFNFGDIAVLYRTKYDGDVIAKQVLKLGMKHIRIDKGGPYSKTPLTRWVEDCGLWCSGGWEKGEPKLTELTKRWLSFNQTVKTKNLVMEKRKDFIKFLFSNRNPSASLNSWLQKFNSECLEKTFACETTLGYEQEEFKKLFTASMANGVLQGFNIAAFAGQTGYKDHLNLMTLHSAKGMEFEVVIMMGLDQGKIPSYYEKTIETKKEPRRLFYVGLTRAKREIHLTYSGWIDGKYGRQFNGPSEFLLEVKKSLLKNLS